MLALKRGIVFSQPSAASAPLNDSVTRIVSQTLTRCRQELGVTTGVLFIRREESIELLGACGYTPQVVAAFATLPLTAHFPLTDCIAENQAIWLRSTTEWERRYPVVISNADTERRAWCAIPLCADGHVVAALGLGWPEEQVFEEAFQQRATAIASDCAAALRELTPDQVAHTRLPLGGELAQMIRAFDWTRTPLGPEWTWPAALRTALSTMLSSTRPMMLWWGAELIQFHNDAYGPLLAATKQPSLLGKRARDCWPDNWSELEPLIASVFAGHEVCGCSESALIAEHGSLRELHFDSAYSPIHDEHGKVAGALITCTETTARVLSERRLWALDQLASELSTVDTLDGLQHAWSRSLSQAQSDLPCALLYLAQRDPRELRLRATFGVEGKQRAAPQHIRLGDADSSLARMLMLALEAGGTHTWSDVDVSGRDFVAGLSSDCMQCAEVVALRRSPHDRVALGYLIAELSPHLAPDQNYLRFVRLVASQLASAVARMSTQERTQSPVVQSSERRERPVEEGQSPGYEQLATTEKWLAQARQIAGIAWFALDLTSGTLNASPELRESLGVRDMDGRQSVHAWSAAVFEDDIGRVTRAVEQALNTCKRDIALEFRLNTSELIPRWVRASADIAYSDDGKPLRVVGRIVDIQVVKNAAIAHAARRQAKIALDARVTSILHGVRVLAVDDNHDARKMLSVMLTRAGATVVALPSAEAALNDPGQYDLIISDIGMPQVDGYELLRRLRAIERHQHVAAIALTGFATERDALAARAAGFQEHMLKPVSFAQLIDTIVKLTSPRE